MGRRRSKTWSSASVLAGRRSAATSMISTRRAWSTGLTAGRFASRAPRPSRRCSSAVQTDRAILSIGERRVLVADHTKFGKFATARVIPLTEMHTIVTDTGLSPALAERLVEAGVELITA